MIFLWVVFAIVATFGLVIFIGAPYVPTHAKSIKTALDTLNLKKGDTVVDLGSGDGSFLKAAAQRGYKAVGYEINPFLCLVAWARCWPVRGRVSIKLRDFWLTRLPESTSAVFVFAAGPYMKRLRGYLDRELTGRNSSLKVISYGFALPGLKPSKVDGAINYYKLPPKR